MNPSRGYETFFPKESPYPNQSEAMGEIYDALEQGKDVVFEGACGTGKTLSALVPSLEIARSEDKTVVITTNVHQQMRQFIEEAREIKDIEDVHVSVFRGKSSMCHIDVGYDECDALRDNTIDLVKREKELKEVREDHKDAKDDPDEMRAISERLEELETSVDELKDNSCSYYYSNLTEDNSAFQRWLKSGVRSPDEIKSRAESRGKCGYELVKEGMEGVDLVICNYHHLLNPDIREYFFKWLDRSPEDVIGVFDEAHNLEDAAREHSSRTLTQETLERAEAELAQEGEEEAEELVESFRLSLTDVVRSNLDFGQAEQLTSEWEDIVVELDENVVEDTGYPDEVSRNFLEGSVYSPGELSRRITQAIETASKIDKRYEREYKSGESDTRKECPSLTVFSFMEEYMSNVHESGYLPIAGVRRKDDEVRVRLELYTCIPSQVTRSMFDQLHASVLMSATLRPFDVLERVLVLEETVQLAYGLEYPEENRETLVAELPPLFSRNRDEDETVKEVTRFLNDVIEYSVGNVLLFFPSQSEAQRYHDRVETDAQKLLDRVGESAKEIRESMFKDGKKVVFTYIWGTLTEGVDFPDEAARTVVVLGVGYPYLSDRRRAVEKAYDDEFGDGKGWEYAIEAPTVRKTRQAIGRIIRSPDDYGVRILADSRYSPDRTDWKYSVYDAFPPEEGNEFIRVDPGKIKYALFNFWDRVGIDVEESGMELD
ncbi:MAG: ATP-dependent DNA helicase [Halobacteria archaeon]|nr:ATP-dependent DNA helicase [Halobacteria archaeon]